MKRAAPGRPNRRQVRLAAVRAILSRRRGGVGEGERAGGEPGLARIGKASGGVGRPDEERDAIVCASPALVPAIAESQKTGPIATLSGPAACRQGPSSRRPGRSGSLTPGPGRLPCPGSIGGEGRQARGRRLRHAASEEAQGDAYVAQCALK